MPQTGSLNAGSLFCWLFTFDIFLSPLMSMITGSVRTTVPAMTEQMHGDKQDTDQDPEPVFR